jgi:outer membrane protein OmpA-like peptidoglycan-associated protein
MQRASTRTILTSALIVAVVAGCAGWSGAQRGAAAGAAGGAVVGGVIGSRTGGTTRGVIIGAAAGGVIGAIIGEQMDRQARELEQNIPGARVERIGEGIAVTFESGLLFDFDSDRIRPEAAQNLRSLSRSLDQYPGTHILVVGHTDSIGRPSYNQSLSERRARSAVEFLMAQGVDRSRLQSTGRGEFEPIASNETETGRQQNRRVEVAIYASEAYQEQLRQQQRNR